jgi:signal transduction histidine kinase
VKLLQAASAQGPGDLAAPGDARASLAGDDMASGRDGLATIAIAGVVHDIGNLIQIAWSAINIVTRLPDMPIHAGPMLDRARACLENAGALARQNIGHIRDRSITRERSSIATCLSDVAALVQAMGEPGLVLEIDVPPDLPEARCDTVGLRRAILNLVLNARDAIAGNGVVLIRARAILHDEAAAGIELCVVDNGVGMSPATIARAFDPFFTTKTDGLGGIGLPMVERFVRDVGGEIAIESAAGVGTTVMLRLPAIARKIGASLPVQARSIPEESDR